MLNNVQSIPPCDTPSASPKIDGSERQETLPVAWKLSDRIAWAMALKVAPSTKLVAVAIAQRAGASSGLAWPGMGTLATDTGRSRSSVIRAVKELEQGGHLTVTRLRVDAKRHASNRYRLPAMKVATVTPPSVRVTLPPSVRVTPEPVRTLEPVKKAAALLLVSDQEGVDEKPKAETTTAEVARHTCPTCGKSWPVRFGDQCHDCNTSVLARPGSRLQTTYADRWRSAHPAGMAAPVPGKYEFLEAEIAEDAPGQSEVTEEAPVAKRPWSKPKRAWRYQRVDGSWD